MDEMAFSDLTAKIGREFSLERLKPLAGNELANVIRNSWREELLASLQNFTSFQNTSDFQFIGSPGQGNWNESPWLAVMHPKVTASATSGFYPVFLFEPGFNSVCLVFAQGAERLTDTFGIRAALVELRRRAERIRVLTGPLKHTRFSTGPFLTMKHPISAPISRADRDPWVASVAYGRRYELSHMPSDAEICDDVVAMLAIYDRLSSVSELQFTTQDAALASLKSLGEVPQKTAAAGQSEIDGAKRVLQHKQVEARFRSKKLVKAVKARLGTACEACEFSFAESYGPDMADYIEAHHIKPLATLPDTGAVLDPDSNDFMVLCSNCHRAIHRAGCPDLSTFKSSLLKTWPKT